MSNAYSGSIDLKHNYYKDLFFLLFKNPFSHLDMAASINVAYEILSKTEKYDSFGYFRSVAKLTPKEYFDRNHLIKYQDKANANFNSEECLKKAGVNTKKTNDHTKKSSSNSGAQDQKKSEKTSSSKEQKKTDDAKKVFNKGSSHDYKQSHKTTEDLESNNIISKLAKNIFDYTTSHKVQTAGLALILYASYNYMKHAQISAKISDYDGIISQFNSRAGGGFDIPSDIRDIYSQRSELKNQHISPVKDAVIFAAGILAVGCDLLGFCSNADDAQ